MVTRTETKKQMKANIVQGDIFVEFTLVILLLYVGSK